MHIGDTKTFQMACKNMKMLQQDKLKRKNAPGEENIYIT